MKEVINGYQSHTENCDEKYLYIPTAKIDMYSNYLCKCNNCGALLIDENPQLDAIELPLQGNEEQMERLEDEDGGFWGCPHCKTDEYLVDLLNVCY